VTIERLAGVRYVVPLREGGSLPAIVDTERDGQFVVKFRGAGQGAKALIAEQLVAALGHALGLPIPRAAIVELADGFGRSEPDPEIQDVLRDSVGDNFGLAYLAGALAFDPAADRAVAPELAADIVWFDAYVTNVDRTVRNTNLLVWHERLWMIDHGAALYVHHRWEGWDPHAASSDDAPTMPTNPNAPRSSARLLIPDCMFTPQGRTSVDRASTTTECRANVASGIPYPSWCRADYIAVTTFDRRISRRGRPSDLYRT